MIREITYLFLAASKAVIREKVSWSYVLQISVKRVPQQHTYSCAKEEKMKKGKYIMGVVYYRVTLSAIILFEDLSQSE